MSCWIQISMQSLEILAQLDLWTMKKDHKPQFWQGSGYMAPECVISSRAIKQSDIYSFGVVALEIACGRKPINPNAKEGEIIMLEWV